MRAAKQENIKKDNNSPPQLFQKHKKVKKEDATFLHFHLIILFINRFFIFCLILFAIYNWTWPIHISQKGKKKNSLIVFYKILDMNAAKQENIKQDNTSPPRSFQKQKKDNKEEDGMFLHSHLIILFINRFFIFCLKLFAVYNWIWWVNMRFSSVSWILWAFIYVFCLL